MCVLRWAWMSSVESWTQTPGRVGVCFGVTLPTRDRLAKKHATLRPLPLSAHTISGFRRNGSGAIKTVFLTLSEDHARTLRVAPSRGTDVLSRGTDVLSRGMDALLRDMDAPLRGMDDL